MELYFSYDDIANQLLAFMQSLDIAPVNNEHFIFDGTIHRYKTKGDRGSEKSGAYCVYMDGIPAGFVQDWRKGEAVSWCFDLKGYSQEQRDYINSDEFKKQAEQKRIQRERELAERQAIASEHARTFFEQIGLDASGHPYLKRKNVNSYGLHINKASNAIAVPLRNIEGKFMSIQWIDANGDKQFFSGAPTSGAFYSLALDTLSDRNNIILLGEGYATMAKIYELTGRPVVAAMSCYFYHKIALDLKTKYPKCKIFVMADNDKTTEIERGFNPGILHAQKLVIQKLADAVIYPVFNSPEDGTDWNDYALFFGDENASTLLNDKISWELMTEKERQEILKRQKIMELVMNLDPSVQLPPQVFIGGIFPAGFLSVIVASPGTGKTMFMQKFVSDLSIGGSIFDGITEDEPERKCLIFAGEAGYELLTRRGASTKWKINPHNVQVVDQYKFDCEGVPIMLDEAEGWLNVLRLVDIYKPDIIFFDTYASFHEKDENKATDMKPIVKKLTNLARERNIAIVLVHHSRKRTAKERSLSLHQDDVIGSSVLNKFVGLTVGIEPMKDDEKVLLVRSLKSWFSSFMPFTYTLKEGLYGGTVIHTDLTPASVGSSKIAVWNYLIEAFKAGEWFSPSNIIIEQITPTVSLWQVRRILADFVKNGRLLKRGSTKGVEYCIPEKNNSD